MSLPIRAVVLGAVLLTTRLSAQSLTPAADTTSSAPGATSARVLRAHQVERGVFVDGRLDEPEWQAAPVAGNFVQSEPRSGEAATEATEVRVLYDAERLYIGAYLHDRAPGDIVVNDIRKDFNPDQQDDFEVILDTFRDRRNGYVFITNVAGARADRQVANEGREINTSWDAVWTVKTQRVSDGWMVEMAIPFRTLRFDFARAENWGINFSRRIRRRNEVSFWAPVPRAYTLARVSLAGELTGIAHSGTARDLRVKPYVAGRSLRETGGLQTASSGDAGLDVKYGVTPGLTLDLTLNPDFAQAEADEQQVNLTQFSQFFPEKREFFLENSGIFYVGDAARNNRVFLSPTPDEDMLLFFSRRVGLSSDGRDVSIPAGLRLTGSVAGITVGALSMRTQSTAIAPASQYSVLRLRRNLFAGSDVGIIALDREGIGAQGNWNRLLGLDANFRLPGDWDWNSYGVGSRKPGKSGGQYTYRSSIGHEGNFMHVKAGVLEIGSGFSDDIGYFRRTDTRKYILDFGVRPRPTWLGAIGVREMHPHVTWNYYENLRGEMTAKNLHTGYSFFFSQGGFAELSVNPNFQRIGTPFTINRSIAPIPVGSYGWTEYQLRGGTNASRPLSASYSFIAGGLWSGRQRTQQLAVTARPSEKLGTTIGVSHTEATLDLPAASFEALLYTARANYSFTTNMFFDALTQYDPRQHLFNANLRFNIIHRPLSDLFIVLNQQRITTPDAPASGFGVIVKFTQMFSL
ncbi:MAG: carbohydrate binding family 9 domain-containing protein [Gemmatimonadaceae bacterium]|nr:carbohydrate binding family 9 domain-containing protein [Gemmatimonadaceae bacterium]